MRKNTRTFLISLAILLFLKTENKAQITLLQDYKNYSSPAIGTFQGIHFREAGFSALYPIAGTNGKEFWTCSDRGVNVDAANANPAACRPTYDKIYGFPGYAPKIHRIRINGDSIQILKTITMKRPGGTTATGIINPTGLGSTNAELASTDTVLNCANFSLKIAAKDTFGIDSEGLVVDQDGNFWICEEGGPTVWKLNKNGVVIKRFTPYANLPGVQSVDVQIDTVFKYRKNNRGFEGIAITPNGKIYAIIQSPILYPTKSVGEGTRIHRILEINPVDNSTRMFSYLNDGIIGSGSNQIRLRDWKIGDMSAINNNEFLVLEAALRGTTDIKRMYKIDISTATPVHSGLYSGVTLEALVDATGLAANSIVPVTKTLVMDLLSSSWPAVLEKAEGLAIINDSTIAIGNDNDYGQLSPGENGVASPNGILSHVFTYRFSGSNKLSNFSQLTPALAQGQTGPSTSQGPYVLPSVPNAQTASILTAGDMVGGYKMAGIPDGTGAYDNGDNTFTLLVNHEIPNSSGIVRAHGSKGAFVSKWVINKSDLSVVSGSDLIQHVNIWNGAGYDTYNSGNPSLLAAFSRFCSADLPAVSSFYNHASSLGTQERIFMNGEETGNEGRAFGHIASGINAGISYQLPRLGRLSYENSLANPMPQDKTIVASTDDSTPGQVYIYIGNKTNSGSEVDKAGLTNGKLFGVVVSGLATEVSTSIPPPGTPFTLADLGNVENITGATLNANSNIAGVTNFLRPEDGAWDPRNPSDFYFVTTNSFSAPSRLWKLQFSDISNPEVGGTITAVLEGTEGQKMFDNMTLDNYGHILLQEDVGNNVHNGKIWQYTISTDALEQVGEHDATRFLAGGSNFLTQDEEASGIIDAQEILGQGYFLMVDQTHYSIPGEVFEGGQILSYFNPGTYNAAPNTFAVTGGGFACFGNTVAIGLSKSEKGVSYQLILNGITNAGSPIAGTGSAISFGNQSVSGLYTVLATNIASGVTANMSGSAIVTINPAISVDAGSNKNVYVGYAPQSCISLTPVIAGGTPGYYIVWSTGDTTGNINVCPDTSTVYSVIVTDSKACTAKDSVKVCAQNVVCGSYSSVTCTSVNGKTKCTTVSGKKIRVCHNGTTLCINDKAVAAHLAHGDYLGTCGSNNCEFVPAQQRFNHNEDVAIEEEMAIEGLSTRFYPNPVSASSQAVLEIKAAGTGNLSVILYNVNGQEIRTLLNRPLSIDGESVELHIDTSNLQTGVYFTKTTTDSGEQQIDKFLITK